MTVFTERPGAVVDDGAVAHYGDPIREQRALIAGRAVVLLGDRTVVEVAGPERLNWLDSFTSQATARLRPGEGSELLILDPQGHVEHAAGIVDDGASAWLIVDAADAESLVAWLKRMVFRAQVTVQTRPDLSLLGYFAGGAAQEALANAGPIWADPWEHVQSGGHQYSEVAEHPSAGYAWRVAILPADAVASLAADLETAGLLAAEALRVAAWRPRWAAEVDERTLPHETDWIRSAVHLNKGCYRGQETVAKVHNLGHPPRRLAALHLDGSEDVLPVAGMPVYSGDAEVGHVTSVARHYEDGPIALAILSRRAPEGDLTVRADGVDIAAAQQVIVPADAGATADVPRLTRLSRRPSAPDPRDA